MTTIKTNRVSGAITEGTTKRITAAITETTTKRLGTSAITESSSKRTDLPRYRHFEGDIGGFHLLEGDSHGLFRELQGDQA